MRFYSGQRVVCIEGGPWKDHTGVTYSVAGPHKGDLYTVRGYAPRHDHMPVGHSFCYLFEVVNPPAAPGYGEPAFNDKCFAPVLTRDTTAEVEKLKRLGQNLKVQDKRPEVVR